MVSIQTDRRWEVLPAHDRRAAVLEASRRLGRRVIQIGGATIDAPTLKRIHDRSSNEPLVRVVREQMRLAMDVDDLLLFVDDVLVAGRRVKKVFLTAGRARQAGIMLHPSDVFGGRPRQYGEDQGRIAIDEPPAQAGLRPPRDRALLGPRWTARYRQPTTEAARMTALAEANPDFAARVQSLRKQLLDQGAIVYVEATLRDRRRGYLMYGAYWLSRAQSRRQIAARVRKLDQLNRKWKLGVPIRWRHPRGWRATRLAARRMSDTYGVDYATRRGAEKSDHYDGRAIDLFAVGLPRQLVLTAPDGAILRMDLSDPNESRDLSLTPALIDWIEAHFELEKLRSDYPHWRDRKDAPEEAL